MEDWYKLRENLVALGNPTVDLDKKILDKGIWTRKLSSKLEEVFQSLFKEKIPISKAFIDFCNYEVLINEKILTNDTIEILEDVFEKQRVCLSFFPFYNYGKSNIDAKIKRKSFNLLMSG